MFTHRYMYICFHLLESSQISGHDSLEKNIERTKESELFQRSRAAGNGVDGSLIYKNLK